MLYLLDTNVLSELRKGPRCDPAVAAWERTELFVHKGAVSVIVLGEIRRGIELIALRDPVSGSRLESWFQGLCRNYSDRILPVTHEIAEEWGRLNARRPLPAADSLLAATANVHGLILATRNVGDLAEVGVRVTNPFDFAME